jgi:hypothetical protein
MIARLSLYLLIVSLFASCFSNEPQKSKTEPQAFPIEKKMDEVELFKVDRLHPDYIDLYKDSVLCFVNARGEEGYHIALYHLAEKTFLPPLIEMGAKMGQSLSFNSFGYENKYFWCYDLNKEKIIFSGLDKIQDTSNNHSIKEMPVPGIYYSVQLLNDSTLLANGDYHFKSGNDYQLSTIDLTNGKITNQLAPYADDSSTHYNLAKKMAYESFLFVKPSKNKCVLACRYTDRIEIVDLNSGKSKFVSGPEGFKPEMKVLPGRDGKKISIPGRDTRQAYVRGQVTNNYIYLLYSGNKEGTPHLFFGKYIYVYDWEGNPVQRLELNDDVIDFAVTGNDSLLYTYNPRSKFIHVAKLTNQ